MLALYRLAGLLFAPLWLLLCALHPRLRQGWRQRLAWDLPPVPPGCVWVHASSVGEGRAAAALLAALREARPGEPLLRTASTDTGLSSAQGHDLAWHLPLDIIPLVRRFLNQLRPSALLLVEGELWPNLLLECRARGVPVLVIGARVGPGLRRFHRLAPGLLRELSQGLRWLARSEPDLRALQEMGIPSELLGDLKLEAPAQGLSLGLPRPLLVAASTRPGDEARLLHALAQWPGPVAPKTLLLAPRHLERLPEIEALLRAQGHRWTRRSNLPGEAPAPIVLLDTLGELAGCLGEADLVFMGGSFDPQIGGHSPAEALAWGKPVVAGPEVQGHLALYQHPLCTLTPAPQLAQTLALALERAVSEGPGQAAPERRLSQQASAVVLSALGITPPEAPLRPALWPLVPLISAIRRVHPRPWRAPIPVVSVGGLSSGGAGKTPAVAWLAEALHGRGLSVVVLTRGYGRSRAGPALRESPGDAHTLGDEAAWLAARGLRVISCPDRRLGARRAVQHGAQVLILDDGFQHHALARDLDIVVVDAARPLAGGLLPVGDAREGPQALSRAQALWVQGEGSLPPGFDAALPADALRLRARVVPRSWRRGAEELPLSALGTVYAFAGIAWPERFLFSLVRAGVRLAGFVSFPDHHPYGAQDLRALQEAAGAHPLVTTEKDAVRLPPGLPCYTLRIELELEGGEALIQRIERRVRQ